MGLSPQLQDLDSRGWPVLDQQRSVWETLERSGADVPPGRRGWLVRRVLVAADLVGLTLAFVLTELLWGWGSGRTNRVGTDAELLLFLLALVGWVLAAKLYGLYDRDEERTDPSTVDDVVGVFHVVTVGAWLLLIAASVIDAPFPDGWKAVTFWALAITLVCLARVSGRAAARRSQAYQQSALIVGAGDVGQLVARKIRNHREYGIELVGFVDANPRELAPDLADLPVLGPERRLPEIVEREGADRVIVAFSQESATATLAAVRRLHRLGVHVDIVPRLFDVVGPNVAVNTVEGLQLMGLAPVRPSRTALSIKRGFDMVVAGLGLVVTAPLLAYIAIRVKRDSPGPVLFRQRRLGMGMREFTALKFRTMRVDTEADAHRAYVQATMSASVVPEVDGLYKLDRSAEVTRTGAWLRRTSLDELPQLWNVLRGEMSLVGPRPCLPYEAELFSSHHLERFAMPAGMTGLWQVKARAFSSFGEALDMDVAYVRSWSFGLDLRILGLTPLQLLRPRGTR